VSLWARIAGYDGAVGILACRGWWRAGDPLLTWWKVLRRLRFCLVVREWGLGILGLGLRLADECFDRGALLHRGERKSW
jgi:hypothetical protein